MKNKFLKIIGIYFIIFAVCTTSYIAFASSMRFRNEGEKPAPVYPKNKNNETYGSLADAISEDTEPDLVLVQLADGTLGYVKNVDLKGKVPNNPKEAIAIQIEKENRIKKSRGSRTGEIINVYDVNAEIIIGEFFIFDELPTKDFKVESLKPSEYK